MRSIAFVFAMACAALSGGCGSQSNSNPKSRATVSVPRYLQQELIEVISHADIIVIDMANLDAGGPNWIGPFEVTERNVIQQFVTACEQGTTLDWNPAAGKDITQPDQARITIVRQGYRNKQLLFQEPLLSFFDDEAFQITMEPTFFEFINKLGKDALKQGAPTHERPLPKTWLGRRRGFIEPAVIDPEPLRSW